MILSPKTNKIINEIVRMIMVISLVQFQNDLKWENRKGIVLMF